MQRKRDGLVPIGEAFGDLGGPVKAIRETPPQARRGFTLADQVEQGKYYSDAQTEAWGREMGIASGKVRREHVKDRDGQIIQLVMCGDNQKDVADRFGLSKMAITKIVCRDAPLWKPRPLTNAERQARWREHQHVTKVNRTTQMMWGLL